MEKRQKSVAPSEKTSGTFWLYLIDQNFVTLLYLSAKEPGEDIIVFPQIQTSLQLHSAISHIPVSLWVHFCWLYLQGYSFPLLCISFLYSFLYWYFWLAHSFRFLSSSWSWSYLIPLFFVFSQLHFLLLTALFSQYFSTHILESNNDWFSLT